VGRKKRSPQGASSSPDGRGANLLGVCLRGAPECINNINIIEDQSALLHLAIAGVSANYFSYRMGNGGQIRWATKRLRKSIVAMTTCHRETPRQPHLMIMARMRAPPRFAMGTVHIWIISTTAILHHMHGEIHVERICEIAVRRPKNPVKCTVLQVHCSHAPRVPTAGNE